MSYKAEAGIKSSFTELTEAEARKIFDRWGLRPGIMRDDYLDKPSEIYSRLMELRYNNNLDPNHEYTLEEVRELRNKNHTGDYLIRTKINIIRVI